MARDGRVEVLPSVEQQCSEVTGNRKLCAVSAFYQHAARQREELGELLTRWQPAGRRGSSWQPFLHHVSKRQPVKRAVIRLRPVRRHLRALSPAEVQTVLDSCDRLRNRLMFAVLHETGMRIGEALGPRHEDWSVAEKTLEVVLRENDNRARSKSGRPRTIPVSAALVRLYAN